jgi:DNA gyrase/topoisomerase IV subunit A
VEWEDRQLTASQIEARLAIVEALIWASEHPHDVVDVVTDSPTQEEALRRFMGAPYMLSETHAHHVLETPLRRFSPENVAALHDEADRFRRRLESLPATP